MTLEEKKTKWREEIKKLKEEIEVLNQQIIEALETVLENSNSEDDIRESVENVGKGLEIIELV